MPLSPKPAFLVGVQSRERIPVERKEFPFDLNWLAEDFCVEFTTPVTFLVGENGSGKSTLLEAIAALSRLPVSGGSFHEIDNAHGPEKKSELATVLEPVFVKRPRDGYFFRAEFMAHFATLLEQREADPHFGADPYALYGGRSLHNQSHGESFLSLMQNRLGNGLYLMDEPESALSPQRQLTLLALIAERLKDNASQFIIATHSPILLTYPGATILNFDEAPISKIELEDTSHYNITRGILERPELYWKHLSAPHDSDAEETDG